MQVIFLPGGLTVLLCFVCWTVFQLVPVFLCLWMPDRMFRYQKSIYRTFRWEDEGRIYSRVLKVHRWKKLLPDGGGLFRKGIRKRNIDCRSTAALERFLTESCRGELSHWLAILPVWVFGLFTPPGVFLIMILYALVINMPCIIAQRFNRPRIAVLLDKLKQADSL